MRVLTLISLSALLSLSLGCNPNAPAAGADGSASQRAQLESIRQEIDSIPPPAKSRYMAVRSLTSWENPWLTIQGSMITLHVTLADANPSSLGVGGILRPVGARRQDLNIRTADLPTALNAVPETAWPYGRVVAVEEAHETPAPDRPQVRRNMEVAMKTLSDLGVVAYEWQGGAGLH